MVNFHVSAPRRIPRIENRRGQTADSPRRAAAAEIHRARRNSITGMRVTNWGVREESGFLSVTPRGLRTGAENDNLFNNKSVRLCDCAIFCHYFFLYYRHVRILFNNIYTEEICLRKFVLNVTYVACSLKFLC